MHACKTLTNTLDVSPANQNVIKLLVVNLTCMNFYNCL